MDGKAKSRDVLGNAIFLPGRGRNTEVDQFGTKSSRTGHCSRGSLAAKQLRLPGGDDMRTLDGHSFPDGKIFTANLACVSRSDSAKERTYLLHVRAPRGASAIPQSHAVGTAWRS